jgi:hypothetical protein
MQFIGSTKYVLEATCRSRVPRVALLAGRPPLRIKEGRMCGAKGLAAPDFIAA